MAYTKRVKVKKTVTVKGKRKTQTVLETRAVTTTVTSKVKVC